MPSAESLFAMTIAELRAHAKENGVKLTGATTKAAIVERILAESGSKPAGRPAAARKVPRRAMIIADEDGEDAVPPREPREIRQPNRPRPAVTTSTGKNKPVFTLQGSRAWHNPQPFVQNQTPHVNKYAPQTDQPISTFPRSPASPQESRFASNIQPRLSVPRTSPRFGPEARSDMPEPSPIPMPPVREAREYPAAPQQDYQRPSYRDMSAVQEAEFQPFAQEPAQPEPEKSYKEPALNPAVPEMLATGDCGEGAGILEIQPDGYGFLRAGNLLPGKHDVYISGTQIRRFRLRNGDYVQGKTRPQRKTTVMPRCSISPAHGEETDEVAADNTTGVQAAPGATARRPSIPIAASSFPTARKTTWCCG